MVGSNNSQNYLMTSIILALAWHRDFQTNITVTPTSISPSFSSFTPTITSSSITYDLNPTLPTLQSQSQTCGAAYNSDTVFDAV